LLFPPADTRATSLLPERETSVQELNPALAGNILDRLKIPSPLERGEGEGEGLKKLDPPSPPAGEREKCTASPYVPGFREFFLNL
jgi:hypothetical protein